MNTKYRKKPVVIDAVQLTNHLRADASSWPDWLVAARHKNREEVGAVYPRAQIAASSSMMIHTLEGVMEAQLGDYIIRGIKGELYPCKPDIFEATYDAAPDAE